MKSTSYLPKAKKKGDEKSTAFFFVEEICSYANIFARLPSTSRAETAYLAVPLELFETLTFNPADLNSLILAGNC